MLCNVIVLMHYIQLATVGFFGLLGGMCFAAYADGWLAGAIKPTKKAVI